ncbi:hypothetical protein [Sphingobacterium paludis]|jgi:hypothetical protein|uniref:Uncharacterized protein n=1 Tax=Sphingobacterium paludis TaxID=1476465 RepID=A0A4R7CXV9_9SPHI|nr:hypothetical protein [Sphingobacterium paludis]TDS13130.1 hypothetical protein B0I21_105264 [Sphingobacterium paludis]
MEDKTNIYDPEEPRDDTPRKEVPRPAQEEVNDKPAGRTIAWTIVAAVAVLALIYFLFFYGK